MNTEKLRLELSKAASKLAAFTITGTLINPNNGIAFFVQTNGIMSKLMMNVLFCMKILPTFRKKTHCKF